jgi:flavin reductase (DIM6/NTAB) family NADH-FMN oxidoreductase RutF
MSSFNSVSPDKFDFNFFDRMGRDTALLCATDNNGGHNFMTVGWGGIGIMWGKPCVYTVIRPQRHTYNFAESGEYISLSFLPSDKSDILKFCGSKSGKDVDKEAACGFTAEKSGEAFYCSLADTVIIAKKTYSDFMREESFHDKAPVAFYKAGDFHKMYISEITDILVKNNEL